MQAKKKTARRSLVVSAVALFLSVAMLVGTTFAWFTDSVTSGTNKIQAGNLDIELYHKNSVEGVYEQVTEDTDGLFQISLWEPGKMVFEEFKIENAGSLALKYKFGFNALGANDYNMVPDSDKSLLDVLYVHVEDDYAKRERWVSGEQKINEADVTLKEFMQNPTNLQSKALGAGASDTKTVYLYWPSSNIDNDYNLNNEKAGQGALYVNLSVSLIATQYTSENDSFDNQYDHNANYQGDYIGFGSATGTAVADQALTITIPNNAPVAENTDKDTTLEIPVGALASDTVGEAVFSSKAYNTAAAQNNFYVTAEQRQAALEVGALDLSLTVGNASVTNFNSAVTVTTYIQPGLSNVEVKYSGDGTDPTEVDYRGETGQLTFKTNHFSTYVVTAGLQTDKENENTYLINNKEDLLNFAKMVNRNGHSFSGETVKLTADIDLTGKDWIPVGQTGGYSAKTYFQGTFDGNGKAIRNLNIPESTWEAGSVEGENFATGFFGFIDVGGTTIKNVTFDKATVEGHHWVGVAVGYMTGTVSGVKVTDSTITSSYKNSEADGDKAGGVVGYLNSGSVNGCTVTGSTITAVRDSGSVVGYTTNGTITGNTAENCTVYYSTDNVEQIGGEIAGKRALGVSDNTATNVTVTKLVSVSTAAELSAALNATYNADTTIKLANDIDLPNTEWGVHALEGANNANLIIDGNGKTISGLCSTTYTSVNGFNSNGLVTAIKSSLSSVTFKNLTVSGANLTNNGEALAVSGVFVGDINTVKVTFDTCTVTDATVNSEAYAAGFVGYVQDVYKADPNLNCPTTLKNCSVTNSKFTGGDATGALVGLNNGSTIITGATVTGNIINGGEGYSAAALVGTSINGTTATDVTASGNTFSITNTTGYQVNDSTYGYIYHGGKTYSVNGDELNGSTSPALAE